MAEHDLQVSRDALSQASLRYSEVGEDHRAFVALTDVVGEIKADAEQNSTVAAIMEHQQELVGALRSVNYTAGYTIRRLTQALEEAHDVYQRTEDNNQDLANHLFKDLGAYPTTVPLPEGLPNERCDWSDGSAADFAKLDEPLRQDWAELDLETSVLNLDFSAYHEFGSWLASCVDKLLGWTHVTESVETVKAEWLPVYQMGEAVMREADGYRMMYYNLKYDRDVLHSNWEGSAGDAAAGAMTKIADWFDAVQHTMAPLGFALEEKAESSVVAQQQVLALVMDVVGLIPTIPALIVAGHDVLDIGFAVATGDWGRLLATVWDLILLIAGYLRKILGLVLAIWHLVLGVIQVIRYLLAALGPDSLELPPPPWG